MFYLYVTILLHYITYCIYVTIILYTLYYLYIYIYITYIPQPGSQDMSAGALDPEGPGAALSSDGQALAAKFGGDGSALGCHCGSQKAP